MKAIIAVLTVSTIVLSFLFYRLSSAFEESVSINERHHSVIYGRIESVKDVAYIAASHITPSDKYAVIRALQNAKVAQYDSLTASFDGGWNVNKKVDNMNGGTYDECQYWAAVTESGALEIGECKKDIEDVKANIQMFF